MPTYDFKCKVCGEAFTKMVKISERDSVRCPVCNGESQQAITGFGVAKGSTRSGSGCEVSGCANRGFG